MGVEQGSEEENHELLGVWSVAEVAGAKGLGHPAAGG